jgi:hypothetical protein
LQKGNRKHNLIDHRRSRKGNCNQTGHACTKFVGNIDTNIIVTREKGSKKRKLK